MEQNESEKGWRGIFDEMGSYLRGISLPAEYYRSGVLGQLQKVLEHWPEELIRECDKVQEAEDREQLGYSKHKMVLEALIQVAAAHELDFEYNAELVMSRAT